MSNFNLQPSDQLNQPMRLYFSAFPTALRNLILVCLTLIVSALLVPSASAQTLTLVATNNNLYVGGGIYSGTYSNFQIRASVASASATVPFILSAVTPPPGVTVSFSTNNFTNTQVVTLSVAVANVAKGTYALTIQGQSNSVTAYTTNFNLIVGTRWTNQSAADVNWSTASSWSGGAPSASDDVMFQDGAGPNNNTNYVQSSTTINSLTYIRSLSGTNHFTTIAPGATLSVLGTNGFGINVDSTTGNSKTIVVNIAGAGGSLVVSNKSGNFSVNSDSTVANATFLTMSNLDNFSTTVSRFSLGDVSTAVQGGVGAQNVVVSLAKTNQITALFSTDLTGTNTLFFGLSLFNNTDPFNNGSASTVNLGFTNAIFADNIAVGQSRCGGSANILRFNPAFTNANGAYAFFRNTNGGRISLLAVGVDSGNSNPGSNAKGNLLFSGGTVDMLVDTMWLGRDRNSTLTNNGAAATANLTFGPGKVDVNQLRMGYNEYTNNSWAQGTLIINTNGILSVNNYLELGFVAGDYTGTGSQAAQSFGQVTINGGTARVNQIIVQPGSTNNQITLNVGSLLIVSNTVASPTNNLTTATFNGGSMTLFVKAGSTNVFVTNLVTTVNGGKISIASISGFASYPATNILIAYQTTASHNLGIGSLPPGFNNLQINDNTTTKNIELIINTNAPKNLAWRGGQSTQWNHADLNWLDLNALTITKFTDGDNVTFDDTAAVPTAIDIVETVLPGQTGTGIKVTNNVNNFTFNNAGGSIGGAALVKTGSKNLQLDATTSLSAQVQQGSLTGAGSIGSASISAGATLDFSGTIGGALTSAGATTIESAGIVNGAVTLQTGSVATNLGTIQGGALTMQSGTSLYNSGTLGYIGTATVATNAILINANTIGTDGLAGNTLTVDGTFKDLGASTTLFLDSLTIEGSSSTFIPGGDGIGTTKFSFNHQASGHTLIRLLPGSTTVFKVNLANVPPYTTIDAERFVFGPNHSDKRIDGCTLLVTNLGAPYSGPQSLALFVNSYSGPAIGDAGLNTTNSYPIIVPASPGTGLGWDVLSDLRPDGLVKIIGIATNPTNIMPTFTVTSSNIVTEITWPSDHIGWNLQQLTTTTAVGVSATNWVSIFGSTLTNDVVITNGTVTADAAIFYRLSNQ